MTVCLVVGGLFAIASWSESRSTAVLARASLEHARNLGESKEGKVLRQFEREVVFIDTSTKRLSTFAVAMLCLSFTSIVVLWLPSRREEDPNKVSEPAPGAVTPRANE